MLFRSLWQLAKELAAHGLATRFVSLGHVGHGYPADMQERMREPMQWVASDEDGAGDGT